MSSTRRLEKNSGSRRGQSNKNRTLPPSRRNDEDDANDIQPPSAQPRRVDDAPDFAPDTQAASRRRSNGNEKKDKQETEMGSVKRSKGSKDDKPSLGKSSGVDGPEFSPDAKSLSNRCNKSNGSMSKSVSPQSGGKRNKMLGNDGSPPRAMNDGLEFTPDNPEGSSGRRSKTGDPNNERNTIPFHGGKEGKQAEKDRPHRASDKTKAGTIPETSRSKEQFGAPGAVLSSRNQPAEEKLQVKDRAEFSPNNRGGTQSQVRIKEKIYTTAKGGASDEMSDTVARRPPKEREQDEKVGAKAIHAGQAAAAPGAVFSDESPHDKSSEGKESHRSNVETYGNEKSTAKAARSGRAAAAPGVFFSDDPPQDKSLKGDSQPELSPLDGEQPELTPLDGGATTAGRRIQAATGAAQGDRQSVASATQSTATDVQPPTVEGDSSQTTSESVATPFRPRPPVRTTQVGAHRVAGLDGENGPDDLDDIVTIVSAPIPDDGRSQLPVARMADDSSEDFLADLGEAEPLSPEDLKNQGIRGWIRQHKRLAAVAVFVVIAAVIGGAVGGVLGGASPAPEPTFAPTFSPTAAPTLEGFEMLVDALTTITPYSILTDPTSPRNAAVTWLMREDEYSGVDFDDAPKLLERYALATIYFATKGTAWTRQLQFLTNQDVCSWNEIVDDSTVGVKECNEQGFVTKLALQTNGLRGTLPEEIAGLPKLVELSAAVSSMGGTIPTGLVGLTNLLEIYLVECGISGTIPQDIGNLAKLTYLAMQKNSLSGTIPDSLFELTNLTDLFLLQNRLSGTIPTEVGNLSLLRQFWLQDNRLSGNIPSDVSRMTSLATIYMNQNNFTGGMENFCTGSIRFSTFYADCYENGATVLEAAVECSCCTTCCFYRESSSGCVPNDDGSFKPIGS